jgi:serine protease Do
MFPNIQHLLNARHMRLRTLAAVLMGFLLVSLAVASGVHRPGATAAALSPVPTMSAPTRPDSFADLAKALSPTVVHVKVTKIRPVSDWQRPQMPEGPWGELYKRFFQELPRQPESRQQGTGSGVIFKADGYILTNYHVVDGADQVLVTLSNAQEYQAHFIGRDPKTDLAVLRIQAPEALPVAPLGDSDAVQVGDWVVAIGNPFGLDHTVTAGIVSAKGRVIGAGPYDDFMQTDASINPGNSGGPLLNMRGEVVGINTAIVPNGQGIGFAIPINTVKPLIPQLVSAGKVTRGYLGLNMQTLPPALTQTLKLPESRGALVSEVIPGGPAAKAGLQRGDVLVTFDGKQVESAHALATLVAATPVGKNVSVMILRDGSKQTVPLTVGHMPSDG